MTKNQVENASVFKAHILLRGEGTRATFSHELVMCQKPNSKLHTCQQF